MTTVANMVDKVRRDLYGGHRPMWNLLAQVTDASTTTSTWTFSFDLGPIVATAFLAVDNEIVYVLAADRNSKTATVLRGQLGTTSDVHQPNSVVEVNARFYRAQVYDTLLEELQSWPPTVYRVATATITAGEGTRGYDLAGLAGDFTDIIAARRAPEVWTGETSDGSWPRVAYRIERNMPTANFASGSAIFFDRSYRTGTVIEVVAKRPFNAAGWADTAVLETDIGVPAQLLDALKYGALWRLMSGREIPRTDTSANVESGATQAVPGLLTTQAASGLLKIRDRRIADEAARLIALYGGG